MTGHVSQRRPRHHPRRSLFRGAGYWTRLGPGIVTGAADDDPSGIGTYSQVGAAVGFGLLWTTLATLPLAIAVQEASAPTGPGYRQGPRGADPRTLPTPGVARCGCGDRGGEHVQHRRRHRGAEHW
jgi:hypothetical protein